MSRVLVTGSAGFIGRHVVAALVGRGFEVHGVDRRACGVPGVVDHVADLMDPAAVRGGDRGGPGAGPGAPGVVCGAWGVLAVGGQPRLGVREPGVGAGVCGGGRDADRGGGDVRGVCVGGGGAGRGFDGVGAGDVVWGLQGWVAAVVDGLGGGGRGFGGLGTGLLPVWAGGGAGGGWWAMRFGRWRRGGGLRRAMAGSGVISCMWPTWGGPLAALLDSGVVGAVNIGSGVAVPVGDVLRAVAAAVGGLERIDFGARGAGRFGAGGGGGGGGTVAGGGWFCAAVRPGFGGGGCGGGVAAVMNTLPVSRA